MPRHRSTPISDSRVGAHALAELVRQRGSPSGSCFIRSSSVWCRARRPRRSPLRAVNATSRCARSSAAAASAPRPDSRRRERARRARPRCRRQQLSAALAREVQVVLVEGVLGAVAAADHAARRSGCSRCARARRRRSTGRGTVSPGSPKNTATGGRRTCRSRPCPRRRSRMTRSAGVSQRVRGRAEHALAVVVRRQLGLPVGEARPRRVAEERASGGRRACWRRPASRRRRPRPTST